MEEKEIEKMFLSKNKAVIDFPFGEDVAVFKVMNKMFGLYSKKDGLYNINVKCDPQDAIAYRDIYACVIPGYHMNKKHWNTIILDGSIEKKIVKNMIDESYDLVVSKLTKKQKEELEIL